MKKYLALTVACVFLASSAYAGQSSRGRASEPSIYEVAKTTPGFEILAAAVEAADVAQVFDGNRHFTVFAPTNAAFEELLSDLGLTAEQLLANKELLTSVLLYHVTRGDRNAASVIASGALRMLDGNATQIWTENGKAYINDSAIVATNVRARNGLIHVIDKVLLPPSN